MSGAPDVSLLVVQGVRSHFAVLAATTSTAVAGPGFRFRSKAPVVVPPKQHYAYIFGYGGFASGAVIDTTGNFDARSYYQGTTYIANPTDIPINVICGME